MKAALKYLYYEMVEKNTEEMPDRNSLSDDEVWRTKYREFFDKYNITNTLKEHTIDTANDRFSFEMAWKNDIWHCYEPVSFYLSSEDLIKDKVYKWAGKLKEISQTNEKIHLTLLSSLNPKDNVLKGFIDEYLEVQNNKKVEVEIIMEKDAEALASQIRRVMNDHVIF